MQNGKVMNISISNTTKGRSVTFYGSQVTNLLMAEFNYHQMREGIMCIMIQKDQAKAQNLTLDIVSWL